MTWLKPILLAILIVLGFAVERANAGPSSLLICQGGGDMQALIGRDYVRIEFTQARVDAERRAPRAGECAWADRPMHQDEPAQLLFVGGRSGHASTSCNGTLCYTRMNVGTPAYLAAQVMEGGRFQLRVRQGRGRVLHVVEVLR
ncbi:hypothetical protein [Aliiroseovarius sp.]|uniref:hypothetical protein n=1 Tax=Aliiroseovarius sp. TaxID=1872442 RepID=UPI003BABA95E